LISKSKAIAKLKEELFALLPPTIFFLVTLNIVAIIRSLMLRGEGIPPLSLVTVAISALVLGKAVLLADMLPTINRFPDRPLIYNVTWKTAIYMAVSLLLHYMEHLIEFSLKAGGLASGNHQLWAEIIWPHFWAIQILLFILISTYCTIHEFVRLLGREKVMRILFGPMPILEVQESGLH
jgi:hypothetical protein